MSKRSETHASSRQPRQRPPVAAGQRYDIDGRPIPPAAPPQRPLRLPFSHVEVLGDDPGIESGLRGLLDTPEARMQDPAVQEQLLREHLAAVDRGPIRGFDFEAAERYWFGRSSWEIRR